MKLILLFPILLYLGLMLVNMSLLKDFQSINLFGAQTLEIPLFLFNSIFIVIYAVFVYLAYSGINSLQRHKIDKLNKEIVGLKSDLYDGQKDLLDTIHSDYQDQFESFRKDSDSKLEKMFLFNQYTLEKVIEETSGDFTKYRNETQKLLAKAKGVDGSILEKLKIWK